MITTEPNVALTLHSVSPALTDLVRGLVGRQAGVLIWEEDIARALARLDGQTLALVIRDLEEFPNMGRQVPEQTMVQMIRTVWDAGRLHLGRRFDDLVSEYE